MNEHIAASGTYTFPGTSLQVRRMGYGAMQLAGPHVFGEPRDRAECIAVLREAVDAGINHIDTSDFYGPHVTNQVIREALHPYPADLVLVTKLGACRDAAGQWLRAIAREELTEGLHSNLRNLGLDSMPIVNLRVGPPLGEPTESIEEPLTVLLELKEKGLIQHIGLSNVSAAQIAEGRRMAEIACVQNHFNVAKREDESLIRELGADGIPYVPYFPLGGFSPLQNRELDEVADELDAPRIQVALAWLLQHAPNLLLIPGTSTREHLRENITSASLRLPAAAVAKLDTIASHAQ